MIFVNGLCHTKINQFKAVLIIKHDIFWLDVSVSKTLGVDVVHIGAKLSEIEASQVFIEWSSVCNDVKNSSTCT